MAEAVIVIDSKSCTAARKLPNYTYQALDTVAFLAKYVSVVYRVCISRVAYTIDTLRYI